MLAAPAAEASRARWIGLAFVVGVALGGGAVTAWLGAGGTVEAGDDSGGGAPSRAPSSGLASPLTAGAGRPAGGRADGALAACQAALSACLGEQARSEAGRWAGEEGVAEAERPDAWIEAVEQAFERCGVPGELVDLDCSTYPCVAVLQIAGDDEGVIRRRIRETWTACVPLQRALGWSGDEPGLREALDAQVFRPPGCPGERGAMLLALAPEGKAARALSWGQGWDDMVGGEIYGALLTRLAQVEGSWSCAE